MVADKAEDVGEATVKGAKKAGREIADKSEDVGEATVHGAKKAGSASEGRCNRRPQEVAVRNTRGCTLCLSTPTMKFGVNTLLWTAGFDNSHLSLLPPIKNAGFNGVELHASLHRVSGCGDPS